MAKEMTVERASKIQETWVAYKRLTKARLQELVRESRRIVDLSESDKHSLISMLVCAEYGQSDVELAFSSYWIKAVKQAQGA